MLIDVLRDAAESVPEQPAIVSSTGSISYAQCVARSHALARGLEQRNVQRFGCVLTNVADVVVCLAAASAAGCEACVYPSYLGPDDWDMLASRFEHRVVITDPGVTLTQATAVALRELELPGAQPPATAGRSPILILTTGTTGLPKGAVHEWSRLIDAARNARPGSGERWLFAYNPNQFGGLQVLLHALIRRATLVIPDSLRPQDAIRSMREHGVTHVSATPTFWGLLAASLDTDTAAGLTLEQITLGGEAVAPRLLEQLRSLFPGARISQIYASTEAGSAVSVRDGLSGLPLSVLERPDGADVQFRIVDGELQTRSAVGMLHYHGGGRSHTDWQGTGDLVEIRDGRIHFVGRASEVINVGGAKVHPLPIEERVLTITGVQLAVAYGRQNAVTGQIVALDVVASEGSDLQALESRIRAACMTLAPAARPRRIRFVPEIEQRGHKLVRQTRDAVA